MANLRRGLMVALVLYLVFALTAPVLAVDDLAKKQAEYQKVQQQMQQLEQKISSNNKASKTVASEINRLDKEITQAEQQLGFLENRLQTTQSEISVSEKDLTSAEKNLTGRQDMLKTRIRALYERGSVSYLEVLLNAHSFTDLINRLGLLSRVVNQDVAIVETIKTEKAQITEQKTFLESKQQEVSGLYSETNQSQTKLASRKSQQSAYKKTLDHDRAAYDASMKGLQATEAALEKLIKAAQKNTPGATNGTGVYVWPTPGYSRITSPFGWRKHPIYGTSNFHAGVDIGAPMGAKIVAADAGIVMYAGWLGAYGQVVILDHGKGISTVYAHTSVLLVQTNHRVSKGQQIAKVGSTGMSTGAHLHFEFRVNGAKQNPQSHVKP